MRSWCSVSSLCDTCPGVPLPPSLLSPSLFDVFALPMQMQQCVEKSLRFDLATFLYGQFVTASIPPLCLFPPLSLSLSLSPSQSFPLSLLQALLRHSKQSLFSVAAFELCHLLPLFLNVSLSLSHTHNRSAIVAIRIHQRMQHEVSVNVSSSSAAQRAERKTLDTNLNSRARRSRSDACKLLQARAVTSLSSTTSQPFPTPPPPPARAHYVTSGDSASKHANCTENSICE